MGSSSIAKRAKMTTTTTPTLTLSSSKMKTEMPLIGLGTWKISQDCCADTIYDAIAVGYRLFDCAADYGNEQQVGLGLSKAMSEGLVTRDELFITSKLWCTFMEKERVEEGCRKSLTDLGLTYVDMYLIHFPIALQYVAPSVRYPPGWEADPETKTGLVYTKATLQSTWEAMEDLVSKGLTKQIGVANFNCSLMMEVLKFATVLPAVNQIEMHPYLYHGPLVSFCQERGIQITAFHSFGGQSLIELGNETAIRTPALLQHDLLNKLATKHSKSVAQILLRWAIERGAAIIPKSCQLDRLKENLAVAEFHLDKDDMEQLGKLDQNLHFNDPKDFANTPIWS